jgi:hypothetical protein
VRLIRVASNVTIPSVITLAGSTVTINPSSTLLANAQYRVVVAAGLTDAVGNPLAATSWAFTTGLLL